MERMPCGHLAGPLALQASLPSMADRGGPDTSSEVAARQRSHVHFLNAKLPRKRNIAQGLLRSEGGEVLLCELTYKSEWDLPGGVVDPKESPAACVVREISEELGVALGIETLLAVNWLPPWRGWDDAVLFLYGVGVVPRSFTDDLTLLPQRDQGGALGRARGPRRPRRALHRSDAGAGPRR